MDVVINPSGNMQWSVYKEGTANELGIVEQSANGFVVLADRDNFLTGVSLALYASKQEAMDAIASKVGGTCSVGV